MTNKEKFAQRGRELATSLAERFDDVLTWRDVYWDRGYNSAGADPIVNADVDESGITAADVTGMITFADAVETFLVANRAYLSKMRSDL